MYIFVKNYLENYIYISTSESFRQFEVNFSTALVLDTFYVKYCLTQYEKIYLKTAIAFLRKNIHIYISRSHLMQFCATINLG